MLMINMAINSAVRTPFRIGKTICQAPKFARVGKIDTAACKKAIAEFVKANPLLVANEFCNPTSSEAIQFDLDASNEKNWKRTAKEKGAPWENIRTFDCTPFDDQLRAYVYDDGSQITGIEIEGE